MIGYLDVLLQNWAISRDLLDNRSIAGPHQILPSCILNLSDPASFQWQPFVPRGLVNSEIPMLLFHVDGKCQ